MPTGTQTPLGNTATLTGARGPNEIIRLLQANLLEQSPERLWEAGTWVLAIEARNANQQAPTLGALVNARITLGSGGAAIVFNVSVIQGTVLQIPCTAVTIDISLTQVESISMFVSATLRPGFTETKAHLLQNVNMVDATLLSGLIPNFARSVQLIGDPSNPHFSAETRWAFSEQMFIGGPELRNLSVNGQRLPVVPGRRWRMVATPSATMINYVGYVNVLDWEISL